MATFQTKTEDGTQIKIEGAPIPEMPNLSSAEPPSNKEIKSQISDAKSKLDGEKKHLDSHGKTLVSDAKAVLDSTSSLISEKNKDERFQKLYLFTRGSIKEGPSEGLVDAGRNLMAQATGMGSKVSCDATDLASYIRESIMNITTSTEYRDLAVEFLNLVQSLLGDLQGEIEKAKTDVQTKQQPVEIPQSGEQLSRDIQQGAQKAQRKIKQRMPKSEDEQLEAIRDKLTHFLSNVSQQREYKIMVNNFFKYSEELYRILYEVKEDAKQTSEVADLRKLLDEAWDVLSDFAGKDSVEKMRKDLHSLFQKIQNDSELRAWGQEAKKLIVDLIENPEQAEKADKEIDNLIRKGRKLSEKYRSDLNSLSREAQNIFYKIRSDPTVMNFQQKLEKLGRDMVLNSKGQPDLFVIEKSMVQIKNLMVEMFSDLLVDVPIKRIIVRNENLDLVLADISVKGTGLIPKCVHVKMASYNDFYLQKSPEAGTTFRLRLRIDEIKPTFKDVKFAYNKKTFPTMQDRGVADVVFEGTGLSCDAEITFTMESGELSKAKLTTCDVSLDSISLNIDKEKTKHDIIDSMLAPLIAARLRTHLQSMMEGFLDSRINQLLEQINDWFATKPLKQMMEEGNEAIQDLQKKKQEWEKQSVLDEKKKEVENKIDEKKKEVEKEIDGKKKEAEQAVQPRQFGPTHGTKVEGEKLDQQQTQAGGQTAPHW